MKTRKRRATDQDGGWKEMLDGDFEAFLEFYFPAVHAAIGFFKGHMLLDKELSRLDPGGRRPANIFVASLDQFKV